jgi:16S rRNA (uracil1498-N3)-methyltransferase
MQRYFVEKDQIRDHIVTITGDDAHHIQRVMRSRVGESLMVSDGTGREAIAEITELDKEAVILRITEERDAASEPVVKVWIAQSLPKGDKMETVIQKCTETGAVRFIPFLSARTIVQYDGKKEAKRLERWQKIAKEAAEQAHRGIIPAIDGPRTWKQLLALLPETAVALICYEQEKGYGLKEALTQIGEAGQSGPVMLIIGPEGGFEPAEVEEILAAGGQCVSLGRRILRTETAALVGLSCILYEYNEI